MRVAVKPEDGARINHEGSQRLTVGQVPAEITKLYRMS